LLLDDNVRAGLAVFYSTAVSVVDGLIRGSAIGVNVHDSGLDPDLAFQRVIARGNAVDFATDALIVIERID